MKKFFTFALMVLVSLSMSAAKKKAKAPEGIKNGPLSFNRVECNLGRVDAGTATRTMTFEFTNVSNRPVSISDLQWEGARLEVSWMVNPTPPQGKNTITVEWTPNYHWEDVPDQYNWFTDIHVLYTDGSKNYDQPLKVGGQIFLKRSEVFNRRIGKLRMHRLNAVWNFCVCGDELPFTMQYANLTDKQMDVQIGLCDKQGHIYKNLIHETLNPMQESKVEPAISVEDLSVIHSTHIAFYVDGALQAIEPVEIIRWDKADDSTRKAWKLNRGYTFEIKGCPYKYVYDVEDEEEWKRLY